ncbi:hypothetical protein C0J52_20832 [Blattella germanica]|nr:hypothetical protein C0J52_20832 [Blattella germanica]
MVMQSIYFVLFLLASTCGLPVRYDQRQDGELNVHAHLENFIIVFIPGSSSALSLLDVIPFKKDVNRANPPNDNKYIAQATGTKLSVPGFPAAKSPYKVDIDKTEESKVHNADHSDVEMAPEVMIAHVPAITLTKIDKESHESTTLSSADEESTQKLVEAPAATEKVEKNEPEKTETAVNHSEEKKVKDNDKTNSVQSDEKKKDDDDNNNKEEKKEQITEDKIENGVKSENKDVMTEEKKEDMKEDKKEDMKEEKKEEMKEDKKEEMKEDKKEEVKDEKKEEKKEEMKEEKKGEMKEEEKKEEMKEELKEDNKEIVKEEKKDVKEEKKDDKLDGIPVIDSAPVKSVKVSKSIDFGIEAARPGLQRVSGDEMVSVDRASRVKTSKVPEFRHESFANSEFARHLKRLRSGINECQPGQTMTDDGQCIPSKSRQR